MALTISDDVHHNNAVRICSAAVQLGKCRLITSHVAVTGAVAAVRKRVAMSYRWRSGTEEERAGVDEKAGVAVSRLLNRID